MKWAAGSCDGSIGWRWPVTRPPPPPRDLGDFRRALVQDQREQEHEQESPAPEGRAALHAHAATVLDVAALFLTIELHTVALPGC